MSEVPRTPASLGLCAVSGAHVGSTPAPQCGGGKEPRAALTFPRCVGLRLALPCTEPAVPTGAASWPVAAALWPQAPRPSSLPFFLLNGTPDVAGRSRGQWDVCGLGERVPGGDGRTFPPFLLPAMALGLPVRAGLGTTPHSAQ